MRVRITLLAVAVGLTAQTPALAGGDGPAPSWDRLERSTLAANNLTSATDDSAKTLTFGYNDDDELTSYSDGRGESSTFAYNSRGLLTGRSDSRGTTTYSYDDLGWLTQLTDPDSDVFDYAYDADGNLKTTSLPNGVLTTNFYDDDGRLERTKSEKAGTVLQDFTYVFDANGNLISETDRNADVTTYGYDSLDRLTDFDPHDGPALSYTYDARGNRTSDGDLTYTYDALNRLTGASDGTTYAYDGAGRLTGIDAPSLETTYSYDGLGLLRGIQRLDIGSQTQLPSIGFDYDGLDRQAERTTGSTVSTTHFSGPGLAPAFETDSLGAIPFATTNGPSGIAKLKGGGGGGASFPLADGSGNFTTLSDGAGQVSSRVAYDPYGRQRSGSAQEYGAGGAAGARTDASGRISYGSTGVTPTLPAATSPSTSHGTPGIAGSLNRSRVAPLLGPLGRFPAVDRAGATAPPSPQPDPTALSSMVDYAAGLADLSPQEKPEHEECNWTCTVADIAEVACGFNGDPVDAFFKGPMCIVGGGPARQGLTLCVKRCDDLVRHIDDAAGPLGDTSKYVPPIKPGSAGGPTAGKRFPERVRREALDENPGTCVYCRMNSDKPQVDHRIPRARGGNATPENAQVACPRCNASKGSRDYPVNPPDGCRGPWPPLGGSNDCRF